MVQRLALLSLLALLGLLAVAPPAVGEGLRAVLVEEKMEPREGPVSFATGRVQLIFPDGRTRLLPYRSHFPPLVVGERLYLLPTREGDLTGIVVYDARSGRTQSFPRPPDLHPYFGSPSFSPDSTRLAYYQVAGESRGRVRVRSWPEGRLLREGPVFPLRATGGPPTCPLCPRCGGAPAGWSSAPSSSTPPPALL